MKALYKLTIVLAAMALSLSAMAQNTIRGTVKDAEGMVRDLKSVGAIARIM